MRIQPLLTSVVTGWLCIGMVIAPPQAAQAQTPVVLVHVHGLAFSPDGTDLLIPSHIGLAVYRAGRWSKADGPQHDYMGFAATSSGYYSSGHPAPGSGLVNPLGLMRSVDGRTWTKLGLEGQADFHLMAASYKTNAVYLYNATPNDRMPRPGLYSTFNDGLAWSRVDAMGIKGNVLSLAVHPTDPKTVAVGTATGLFLSRDAGAHFSSQLANIQVPGIAFDHDGTTLWCSTYDKAAHLIRIDLKGGKITERPLPAIGEDAVAYIAQHPRDLEQIAIATFARSVFVSQDGGKSWTQIADRGRTL